MKHYLTRIVVTRQVRKPHHSQGLIIRKKEIKYRKVGHKYKKVNLLSLIKTLLKKMVSLAKELIHK